MEGMRDHAERNPSATTSATSRTRTWPAPLSFRPSSIMVMQYGQATQMVSGDPSSASYTRA